MAGEKLKEQYGFTDFRGQSKLAEAYERRLQQKRSSSWR